MSSVQERFEAWAKEKEFRRFQPSPFYAGYEAGVEDENAKLKARVEELEDAVREAWAMDDDAPVCVEDISRLSGTRIAEAVETENGPIAGMHKAIAARAMESADEARAALAAAQERVKELERENGMEFAAKMKFKAENARLREVLKGVTRNLECHCHECARVDQPCIICDAKAALEGE